MGTSLERCDVMGYNTLKLYGKQTCDYLYIQSDAVNSSDFSYVDSEPQTWNENTILLSTFDRSFVGGNSKILEDLRGYEIRRRKESDPYSEHITSLKGNDNNLSKLIIDYGVKNSSDYTYYLYPNLSDKNNSVTPLPLVTQPVSTKWNYWSLLVVQESDEDNVFYLDKLFKFEFNLNVGDMNNNAVISINQNFTPYPTVQYGNSNYWSGSLTSLCGFITCTEGEYVNSIDTINELKGLTTDGKRKFLKDIDGNMWEVKIASSITISTNNSSIEKIKSINISWVEVADASGISIINNPNKSLQEWILTKTGAAIPYKEYIWDDNEIWNDDYIWTESDTE